MNAQPMLIRAGKVHPITAAQWAMARAHKPIGPVAGLDASRRAPVAVVPPVPQPPKPDGRAMARANMLARIGREYGADARKGAEAADSAAFRRSGLDPKAAIIGERQLPSAASGSTARDAAGLTMGQRSMLKVVMRTGDVAARTAAAERLGIRAA